MAIENLLDFSDCFDQKITLKGLVLATFKTVCQHTGSELPPQFIYTFVIFHAIDYLPLLGTWTFRGLRMVPAPLGANAKLILSR